MKYFFLFILLFTSYLFADKYELGHGYRVNNTLNMGAYFSLDYTNGKSIDRLRLDDMALLAYGNLPSNFSYLSEFEAAPFYIRDYKNGTSQTNSTPHRERMYLNYSSSDRLNFRLGKFITPIGYWNLEPINVLRDTDSNPLYSLTMFPKFVTGAQMYGYLDEDELIKYHLFAQATDDIDKNYINIQNDFFLGASLGVDISDEINIGSAVGYYETYAKKDVSLLEANAKYDNYPFLLQTEWAYTSIQNNLLYSKAYQVGGYVQGMYNLNPENALVGRYEYFKDTQKNVMSKNHIAIIGYSYRPLYAVSIKGEYQFNSDAYLNQAIISLSVLF